MSQLEDFTTAELRSVLLYLRKKYVPGESDNFLSHINREGLLMIYRYMYEKSQKEKEKIYGVVHSNIKKAVNGLHSITIDMRKFGLMAQEKQEKITEEADLAELENQLESI